MKARLSFSEVSQHIDSAPGRLARHGSSYWRTLKKLPVPDRFSLIFSAILCLMGAFILSPVLLPLWLLGLTKKIVTWFEPPRPRNERGERLA